MRTVPFIACCLSLFNALPVVSLDAQPVEWEQLGSDGIYAYTAYPQSLWAHDGNFYCYGTSATAPYHFVYRSENGVDWQNVGAGASPSKSLTLSNGVVLLYGSPSPKIVLVEGESGVVKSLLPDGQFGSVLAAAEGNGSIVIGGVDGDWRVNPMWWVSSDAGETFTHYSDPGKIGDVGVFEGISGLAYGDGKFVAVGFPGELWQSPDGRSWTMVELPADLDGNAATPTRFNEIQFIGDTFYALGDDLDLYKSSNGTDWQLVFAGSVGYALTTLLVDGSNWHAAGPNGGQIWSRDGGQTWNGSYVRNRDMANLTGGDGMLYAGGYFAPQGGLLSLSTQYTFDWFQGGKLLTAYNSGTWLALYNGESYLGSAPASFLDSATTSDGIYFEHPWLGWFSNPENGWFFHFNMGWIYSSSSSDDSVWIFVDQLGWIYTQELLWPNFYHAGSDNWGVYGGGPTWFYNQTAKRWEEKADFGMEDWIVSSEWLIGKTLTLKEGALEHTVTVVSTDAVTASIDTGSEMLAFGVSDSVTWFDSSELAGQDPGHRFTFDIADSTVPGVGNRVFPLVLQFESPTGGTFLMTYTYLKGLQPFSKANISGSFTVSE